MQERLSFYIHRDSSLHRLNPLTKLTLVLALILVAFLSKWYWAPHLLTLFAVVPLSFVVRVSLKFFGTASRLILPTSTFLFVMQSLFHPIGEENIFEFYFLSSTQESVLYAFRNAVRIIVMVSAFTLFLLT